MRGVGFISDKSKLAESSVVMETTGGDAVRLETSFVLGLAKDAVLILPNRSESKRSENGG